MPTLIPKGLKNWWQKSFTRKRKRTIKEAEAAKKTAYRISRNTRGTIKNIKPISKSLAKVLPPSSVGYKLGTEKPTLYQRLLGKAKGLNKPPTSAPLQEPSTPYPMFKGNTRRNQMTREDVINVLQTQQQPKKFKRTNINLEGVEDSKRRVYRFLLEKHLEALGPVTKVYEKHATNADFFKLSHAARKYVKQNGKNLERMAEEFFHAPLTVLDNEIQIAEGVGEGTRALLTSRQGVPVYAEAYGSYLGRYIDGILETPRKLIYDGDKDKYLCIPPDFTDTNAPIVNSLDGSPYCICCFVNQTHFNRYKTRQLDQGRRGCSHYIILNPAHFPTATQYETSADPVAVPARYFLQTSFIQDAFREQGVTTMDEDLMNLLRNTPEAQDFLIASRLFLLNTTTFDKQRQSYIGRPDKRIMVFADEALPEKEVICDKDPLSIAVVRKSMEQERRFLFCDPYTAYCTKKKNQKAWNQAFGAQVGTGKYKNIAFDIYNELTEREKFFVDFYQYSLIVDRFIQSGGHIPIEQRLRAASAVYREPLYSQAFLEYVQDNAGIEDAHFRTFLELQDTMFSYDTNEEDPINGTKIDTQEKVNTLLKKLQTAEVTIPEGTNAYLQSWRGSRYEGNLGELNVPVLPRRPLPGPGAEAAAAAAAAAGLGGLYRLPASPANSALSGLSSLASPLAANVLGGTPRGLPLLPASPAGSSVRTGASSPASPWVPPPPGYAGSPTLSLPPGYEFPITPTGSIASAAPSPGVNLRPDLNVRNETLRIRGAHPRQPGFPVGRGGPVRAGSPGFGYNATRRARNAAARQAQERNTAEKRALARLATSVAPSLNANTRKALSRILQAPSSRTVFKNVAFGTGLGNESSRREEQKRRELQSNLEMRFDRLSEENTTGFSERILDLRKQRMDLITLLMKSLKTDASLEDIQTLHSQMLRL